VTVGFYYLCVLLALCVTLPVRARAGMSVAPSDLIAFPAAACLVIEAMRSQRVRARLRDLYCVNRVVYWYIGWTLFAAILGLARSSDVAQNVKDLVPSFVLYTLVGLTIDRRERLRALGIATAAGIACHVGLAIVQGVFGAPYIVATSPGLEGKLDLSGEFLTNIPVGLFPHPNALAMFLLPVALVLFALVRPSRRLRWLIIPALLVVLFVLKPAQVKGVYAFLVVGLALMMLPRSWERGRVALGVCLPAAAIVVIMWFTVTRYLAGEAEFATLITRLELWNHAIEVIRKDTFTQLVGNGYPLFGVTVVGTFEYPNAHNAWLNHVLSFGLPGLALYLGCFVGGMRLAARKLREANEVMRGTFLACFSAFAAMFGEYFFEPSDRGEVFSSQLMLLLAVVAVLPRAVLEDRTQ
jgi:hypothetical protein